MLWDRRKRAIVPFWVSELAWICLHFSSVDHTVTAILTIFRKQLLLSSLKDNGNLIIG